MNNSLRINPKTQDNQRGLPIVNAAPQIKNLNTFAICPTHNNYEITNICLSQECLEPLCPECTKTHLKQHYEQREKCELDSIHGARANELKKIQDELASLRAIQEEYLRFSNSKHLHILEDCLQRLGRAKEKLQSIIASFFQTLETSIKNSLENYITRQNDTDEKLLADRLQKKIRKIERLNMKLESPEYLRPLLKVNEKNI